MSVALDVARTRAGLCERLAGLRAELVELERLARLPDCGAEVAGRWAELRAGSLLPITMGVVRLSALEGWLRKVEMPVDGKCAAAGALLEG